MNPDTTFNYLVLGVGSALQDASQPTLFSWACHTLSLEMGHEYPRTQTGLYKLLEQPLQDWYPLAIPEEFDAGFGFLYEGALSEEASDYYDELLEKLDLPQSLTAQLSALENASFRALFDELKQAYDAGNAKAQSEYVLLRRFLIERPYATAEEIGQTFFRSQYATPMRVGGLYEQIVSVEAECGLWVCDRCGPLIVKNEQLRGIKPSVCSDHRKDLEKVHQVPWRSELRRVKPAIHRRVCIPGVPEIDLFEQLSRLCNSSLPGLHGVQLYPGIDCYDLRLQFSDSKIWAVDIKDYPNPLKLTRKLKAIYGPAALRYDKGFYVVPQNYIQQTKNYIKLAKRTSSQHGMQLLGERSFMNRALKQIKRLQAGE